MGESQSRKNSWLASYAQLVWLANKSVEKRGEFECKSDRELTKSFYTTHKDWLIRHVADIARGYQVRYDTPGTLYLHEFEINGQAYSFHSYVFPKNLVGSQPAKENEMFGRSKLPQGTPKLAILLIALDFARTQIDSE